MNRILSFFLALFMFDFTATAQNFVHPGGLHTLADLDRMKAKVAAGEHPWIDGWNKLITDKQAQNTYTAMPTANMGASRQRADADAHAAYLNAIRWYISGDTSYAACARKILNAWAYTVNQVPTGTDISGLGGIPIFDFALAAEVLRIYPNWSSTDFAQFKSMMTTYFYPLVHNFLTNHNGACISHYWANWDIANIGALIAMGVLCDDTAIFNEGIQYFKNGAGSGSIANAVYYMHSPTLGQWQESGRDQEHAQLGVGMMGYLCQVAWNQGVDLFGYNNNRLLAGAEYVARTNLSQPVPYTSYNNCHNANQRWVSINGLGRLDDRPVWELLYNHYVVRQGLSAPNIQAMAQVTRPEHGSIDHFGYGTLTFTLNASSSPYPPSPVPSAPTGVTATAGASRITINWNVPGASIVQGYTIKRATAPGGPYTTIATWSDNTSPQYTDKSATNGTTYYYVVAANNQSGTSAHSVEVSATPMAASSTLPTGWSRKDIGSVGVTGSAGYANVSNNTFVTSGAGSGIGGTSDGFGFTYRIVSGDVTITARVYGMSGSINKTGVMIRESLDPNAKAFIMKLGDVGLRQAGFGKRTTTGGSMSWIGGNDYTWLPAWFRLQRSGSTITAYESSDGVNWFVVGSTTVSMNSVCYVGLVNCSGSTTALNTTTFDNVAISYNGINIHPL
jgi:regulation of enolase protein 1 (concanavalin A-like superfamily)